MRAAEAQDWVRRIMSGVGRYPTRLQRVSISAISEVGDLEIPISAPLTTLCGPNGVGKSIVLKSIHSAIEPEVARYSRYSGIFGGTVELSGFAGDSEFQIERRASDVVAAGNAPRVTFIDSGTFGLRLFDIWSDLDDLADILNDVDALELNGEDLQDVRYITCKDYRFVRLYEVDVGIPAPFF